MVYLNSICRNLPFEHTKHHEALTWSTARFGDLDVNRWLLQMML